MKLMSIFNALDGAHLDRSVFGAHLMGTKRKGDYGKSKQTRVPDSGSIGKRGQGASQTRKRAGWTPGSDAGLR